MQLQHSITELSSILPTKGNADTLAKKILQDIEYGFIDPYELIAQMEAIKIVCTTVRDGISTHLATDLAKYGKEGNKVLDATFNAAETNVKYDYSQDFKWKAFKDIEDEAAKGRKQREKFLQGLQKPIMETDIESGETHEVRPPNRTSETSFKITLGK